MEVDIPYVSTLVMLGDKSYKTDLFGNHLSMWLNIEQGEGCRILLN